MFVSGSLIQIYDTRGRTPKTRLPQFKLEKDAIRQCFLFSNHLIMATRTSGGKLHLMASTGKIPLQEAILIEDPCDQQLNTEDDGESSVCSVSSASSGMSESSGATSSGSAGKTAAAVSAEQTNLDFKIIWEQKSGAPVVIHLIAPTMQEKQAWISDISQVGQMATWKCLDNVHFNNLFRSSMSDTSSITMPHCIKNDPRLFKDDIDIRFSRTLNSCKVPHIRYATPERLLERLTDLRFLSIDFLNTFLLTYRVFCDGVTVLEALKKVYTNPDIDLIDQGEDSRESSVERSPDYVMSPTREFESRQSPRRVSNFSAFSVTPAEKRKTFQKSLPDLLDIAHSDALTLIAIPEDKEFFLGQRQKGRLGSMCSSEDLELVSSSSLDGAYPLRFEDGLVSEVADWNSHTSRNFSSPAVLIVRHRYAPPHAVVQIDGSIYTPDNDLGFAKDILQYHNESTRKVCITTLNHHFWYLSEVPIGTSGLDSGAASHTKTRARAPRPNKLEFRSPLYQFLVKKEPKGFCSRRGNGLKENWWTYFSFAFRSQPQKLASFKSAFYGKRLPYELVHDSFDKNSAPAFTFKPRSNSYIRLYNQKISVNERERSQKSALSTIFASKNYSSHLQTNTDYKFKEATLSAKKTCVSFCLPQALDNCQNTSSKRSFDIKYNRNDVKRKTRLFTVEESNIDYDTVTLTNEEDLKDSRDEKNPLNLLSEQPVLSHDEELIEKSFKPLDSFPHCPVTRVSKITAMRQDCCATTAHPRMSSNTSTYMLETDIERLSPKTCDRISNIDYLPDSNLYKTYSSEPSNDSPSTSTSPPSAGFEMEAPMRERELSIDPQSSKHSPQHWRWSFRKFEEDQLEKLEKASRSSEKKFSDEERKESMQSGDSVDLGEVVSAPTSPYASKKGSPRCEATKLLKIPGGRRGTASSTSSADTLLGEEHDGVQSPTQQDSKYFPVPSPLSSVDPPPAAKATDESPSQALPPKRLNSAFSTVLNTAFSTVVHNPPLTTTSPSPPAVTLPSGSETSAMVHSEPEGPDGDTGSRLLSSRQASISSSSSPPCLQARRVQTPTSPPRLVTNPRRGLPRRMSSLEEKSQVATSGSDAEDEQDSHTTPNSSRKRRSSDNRGSFQLGSSSGRSNRSKRQSCESESSFSAYGSTPRSSLQISTARSSFQLRDFLVLPCKRKLQYITSSIDEDQVLRETFDKVQTLQQKNVFLLVDEVQIRPTVLISGGVLSGMAENNRD
ncbi:Ras-like guanine nucleotide exchange factor N-terminal [Trinorchestia longiramus]|nr:Ras-like guanine nucleotide exchange factor N-terminal [Trinorchestia longiramus]